MTRYLFFHKVLKPFAIPIMAAKFNVHGKRIRLPKGGNLIVANHVTNIDPILVDTRIKYAYMQFVINSNIYDSNMLRKLVKLVNKPILHVKGLQSMNTVREICKSIKKGTNVMLFPEGNTTFDGTTATLNDSIGKLAKLTGGNLVMIKIKGGYLTGPRWGARLRRGRMTLDSKTLLAQELKSMSVQEITDFINESLYTDAYEEQAEKSIAFKGKEKCLGIERAMYMCPKCGAIRTLQSDADTVSCSCGYKESFNAYGKLVDETTSQEHTLKEYLANQKARLKEMYRTAMQDTTNKTNSSDTILFQDTAEVLEVADSGEKTSIGNFEVTVYADHVQYKKSAEGTGELPDSATPEAPESSGCIAMEDVQAVTIFKANTLNVFVAKDGNLKEEKAYQLNGAFSFNALKYRDLFEIVKGN